MTTNKRGLKYDFSLIAILLIPIGVAINVIGAQIVSLLKLPVFLDTIGTALVAIIAGPWVGMITGACTNLVNGIFNPVLFAFTPTSMVVGLVVGLLSVYGWFKKFWGVILGALLVAIFATCVSAPIQVLVFGGAAGNSSDTLVALFLASGQKIWTAVISEKLIIATIDKTLSLTVAYLIVRRMSARYLSKLNYGSIYIKN